MKKKTCSECGAERGTPHLTSCLNSGRGGIASRVAAAVGHPVVVARKGGGVVISRTPLTKEAMAEGLAVSRSSGRIVYHTPMDQLPPDLAAAPCACGSGKPFGECHGAQMVDDESSGASGFQFDEPDDDALEKRSERC